MPAHASRSIPFLIAFLLFSISGLAQQPYTSAQFSYDSLMNVEYGTATDYAGNDQTLYMDIYKPRNGYCNRPVAVLVHGGAWVAGSKEDVDLVYLSRFFVKRGYVVANINYRLGTHKAANYTMYALCNTTVSAPCAYIADSAEVYRANYRAMQDVKGAIRFMKSRHEMDSTDVDNVFLVGQSAGAFISLAVAFTTDPADKPLNCDSLPNAPTPDPDLVGYGCVPNPISYTRPNLGSIEGSLNIGSFDASVAGVASIFGGILDPSILNAAKINSMAIYQFHQGSDVVVHYNYGRLLGRVSWECFAQTNLCQSYFFYPNAYGSKGVDTIIRSLVQNPAFYRTDIVENYQYLNNCFSNGHAIDNIAIRSQQIADLFASKIVANGNQPQENCSVSIARASEKPTVHLYPNPTTGTLTVQATGMHPGSPFRMYNLTGIPVLAGNLDAGTTNISLSHLPAGVYLLQFGDEFSQWHKVVKE